jgi:hypothetical protein
MRQAGRNLTRTREIHAFCAMRYSWSAIANEDVEGYTKGSRLASEVAAFFKVHQGQIIEIRSDPDCLAEALPMRTVNKSILLGSNS